MPGELNAPATDKLYRTIIGEKNTDYFLNYFHRADERGYAPISWNWPVFFFGWLWLLYRRTYRWAAIVFFFPTAVLMLAPLLHPLLGETFANGLAFTAAIGFQAVYVPMKANGFYYHHAKTLIHLVKKSFPEDSTRQLEMLQRHGGVNPQAPAVALLGIFLLMTLLGQFVTPPS